MTISTRRQSNKSHAAARSSDSGESSLGTLSNAAVAASGGGEEEDEDDLEVRVFVHIAESSKPGSRPPAPKLEHLTGHRLKPGTPFTRKSDFDEEVKPQIDGLLAQKKCALNTDLPGAPYFGRNCPPKRSGIATKTANMEAICNEDGPSWRTFVKRRSFRVDPNPASDSESDSDSLESINEEKEAEVPYLRVDICVTAEPLKNAAVPAVAVRGDGDDVSEISEARPATAGTKRGRGKKKKRLPFPDILLVKVLGPVERVPKANNMPQAPKTNEVFEFEYEISAYHENVGELRDSLNHVEDDRGLENLSKLPVYNSDEDADDQNTVSMDVNNFFHSVVENCTSEPAVKTIFGFAEKAISIKSKLYAQSNYTSLSVSEIPTDYALDRHIMTEARKPNRRDNGRLVIKVALGKCNDEDHAVTQSWVDDGPRGDLRFSKVDREEPATRLSAKDISLQSKTSPVNVENWLRGEYKNPQSVLYRAFTKEMMHIIGAHFLAHPKAHPKDGVKNPHSIEFYQAIFRPGTHAASACGPGLVPGTGDFPPVNPDDPKPPSRPPPIKDGKGGASSASAIVASTVQSMQAALGCTFPAAAGPSGAVVSPVPPNGGGLDMARRVRKKIRTGFTKFSSPDQKAATHIQNDLSALGPNATKDNVAEAEEDGESSQDVLTFLLASKKREMK